MYFDWQYVDSGKPHSDNILTSHKFEWNIMKEKKVVISFINLSKSDTKINNLGVGHKDKKQGEG